MLRLTARSRLIVAALTMVLTTACATTAKKHDKHVAKKSKKHHNTETAENFGLYKQDNLNQGLLRQGEKNIGADDKASL